MSIETIYGNRKQMICDNCGEGFEADNWGELMRRKVEDGWCSKRVDGTWSDYCPDCVEAEVKA